MMTEEANYSSQLVKDDICNDDAEKTLSKRVVY